MRLITSARGPLSARKMVLPFSSRRRARLLKTGGQPLKVIGDEERLDSLLHVVRSGGGLLEAVEHLGQDLPQDFGCALSDVGRAIAGAAIVAPEVHAARQASRSQKSTKLVLVPPLADLLLRNKRRSLVAFRLALLPRDRLLRPEQLDRLAIDCIVQGDGPEDCLPLLLAAGAELRCERLELPPIVGEVDVEHHVAIDHVTAVDREAALERLGVEQGV